MQDEIRKKAKRKVDAKMGLYVTAIVFAFVTIVLLMLSSYLTAISFWLRLPIPIFIMVLAIQYVVVFGFPSSGALSKDWQEAEIEKEMLKLSQREASAKTPRPLDSPEAENLELKELERLEEKRNWGEDLV